MTQTLTNIKIFGNREMNDRGDPICMPKFETTLRMVSNKVFISLAVKSLDSLFLDLNEGY